MVKQYAVVRDNIVENVVVWDGTSDWGPPEGTELIDVTDVFVGPGFIRNEDGTFSRPQEPAQ